MGIAVFGADCDHGKVRIQTRGNPYGVIVHNQHVCGVVLVAVLCHKQFVHAAGKGTDRQRRFALMLSVDIDVGSDQVVIAQVSYLHPAVCGPQ